MAGFNLNYFTTAVFLDLETVVPYAFMKEVENVCTVSAPRSAAARYCEI